MSDPRASAERDETLTQPVEREPWQQLGYDKIAAADAEGGTAPSSATFDGVSYS